MITGITGGYMIDVTNNHTLAPYIAPNSSNPMQGVLRINSNQLEVYSGAAWYPVSANLPQVNLTGTAISAIVWAQTKMSEEAELQKLANKHPAVAEAIATLTKAMDELKVIVTLTNE
jgi:hypothetical protein